VLFATVINDLPSIISSTSALYADDFYFWESTSHVKHLEQLCQRSLKKIYQWCTKSDFKISTSTSAALLFTQKKQQKTRQN